MLGRRKKELSTRDFGSLGEKAAVKFLKKQGYKIVGRNVYVGKSELDIIATRHSHIVFAEVKTRSQIPDAESNYGRPSDAVDSEKKRHLIDASMGYLKSSGNKYYSLSPRIDIIEVYADPASKRFKVLEIKHFPDSVHR